MTDLSESPLISICIPTYNRCDKVYKLVTNILKYKGGEVQVIVLDNCSTDNTAGLLLQIEDPRLKFIINEENIGGPMNQLKVLTLAEGRFAFFCLDKDTLDYNSIKDLIGRINTDLDVEFGFCSLNLKKNAADIIYEKGFPSVLNMAYLSQHPTGIFYEANIYRSLPIVKKILSERKHFPFYPDLINAEMAMLSKSQLVNLPAFYTETKDDCRDVPSFTYNGKNAFFSPDKRLVEFNIYIDSINHLELSYSEKFRLTLQLYKRLLSSSTFDYRRIMTDYDVCTHHGMSTRKVGLIELCAINFQFALNFMREKSAVGYFIKLLIVFYVQTIILVKLSLLKIKK